MTQPSNSLSLVADVGGTNTRVALADGPRLLTATVEKVPNRNAESLAALLDAYVRAKGVDCVAAAVAIAGPVHNGRGTLTNLDWSMDCDTLAAISKAETVAVLNDLQAQAYALGRIADENPRLQYALQARALGEHRLNDGLGLFGAVGSSTRFAEYASDAPSETDFHFSAGVVLGEDRQAE